MTYTETEQDQSIAALLAVHASETGHVDYTQKGYLTGTTLASSVSPDYQPTKYHISAAEAHARKYNWEGFGLIMARLGRKMEVAEVMMEFGTYVLLDPWDGIREIS